MAAQRGIVARPSDDTERTRLLAGRRRRRAELRVEEDRERAAAIVTGECLPDRERVVENAAARERAAAAKLLVDERAGRTQRLGRCERAEWLTSLGERNTGRDRGLLSVRGGHHRQRERRQRRKKKSSSSHQ